MKRSCYRQVSNSLYQTRSPCRKLRSALQVLHSRGNAMRRSYPTMRLTSTSMEGSMLRALEVRAPPGVVASSIALGKIHALSGCRGS